MAQPDSFPMLRPQDLPASSAELAVLTKEPAVRLLSRFLDDSTHASDEATLDLLRAAQAELALDPAEFTVITDDPEESTGNRDNDNAFAIVRVRGDKSRLLANAVLRAYVTLLEERDNGGSALDAIAWRRLHTGFRAMIAYLAARDQPEPTGDYAPRPASGGAALQRWIHGHHIFLVLVQGLVITMRCFADNARREQTAATREALRAATEIMWGSEAALRFTGDFPYSEYEKLVRPTLMPPTAPPDMTGLRWRDHEYLIRALAGMRSCFSRLDPRVEPERVRLLEALNATYDSHKSVCAHFVGVEETSVLMSTRSTNSAVSTLEHFKRNRGAIVGSARPDRGGPR
jgi:hypothetical protein